jgi:hypothetical protein
MYCRYVEQTPMKQLPSRNFGDRCDSGCYARSRETSRSLYWALGRQKGTCLAPKSKACAPLISYAYTLLAGPTAWHWQVSLYVQPPPPQRKGGLGQWILQYVQEKAWTGRFAANTSRKYLDKKNRMCSYSCYSGHHCLIHYRLKHWSLTMEKNGDWALNIS